MLQIFNRDTRHVTRGTPLLELGDPHSLEVVADVLTQKAVLVKPGQFVRIEKWGGDTHLEGKVRKVEPSAFTKVSALGVEEQRVNVIVDIQTPPEQRKNLGDNYRVECHIVVYQKNDALVVPTGALFQTLQGWGVFQVVNGKAVKKTIKLSHRGPDFAVIESGLGSGDKVILYPGRAVEEGQRVKNRIED